MNSNIINKNLVDNTFIDRISNNLFSYLMVGIIIIALVFIQASASCDVQNYCGINSNGGLRFFVTNITNNQPILGSACNIIVYYPNNSLVSTYNNISELSGGFYNYTISGNETSDLGIHIYSLNCTKSGYSSSYASSYEVVNTLSYSYFTNWNTWIYDTYTNVTIASSQLMVNILAYLQNKLTVNLSDNTQRSVANKTWEVNVTPTIPLKGSGTMWDINPSKLRKYFGQ